MEGMEKIDQKYKVGRTKGLWVSHEELGRLVAK